MNVLQDHDGNTSSKRVSAFIALGYALIGNAFGIVEFDIFVSLLVFSAGALGISEIGKIRK